MTYHYPKLFFDNKARYGTQTFSSEATGYPAANLKDFRSYTYWRPTVLPASIAIDAGELKWGFNSTTAGWIAAGATLTSGPTAATLSSTGSDPIMQSDAVSPFPIFGGAYRYIGIRIKRTAGAAWDGKCYYSTRAHGAEEGYTKTIVQPQWDGTFQVIILDMFALTNGGTDWRDNLILMIRFDFGASTSDEFEIDWIYLARDPFCDYFMLWGHDCATQGNSIKVEGSDESSSTGLVSVLPEFYPTNDDPIIKTISTNGWTRWKRITFANGSVPTIAMMHVGRALEIPGFLNGIDPVDRMAVLTHNRSAGGYPLGVAVDHEEWEQDLDFRFVDKTNGRTWVRDTWLPAWKDHIRGNPFVLQWNPTDYPNELIMLTNTDGKSRTPHGDLNYAGLQMSVHGRWHK